MPLFVSCKYAEVKPTPPNLELNGELCSIQYETKFCRAKITHCPQGITSITFTDPTELEGIVYSFSGNGCTIMFDDLKLSTDRSFLNSKALPQMIRDSLCNAQQENALVYVETEQPEASTLKFAVFQGETNGYTYTIKTDYSTGIIKQFSFNT